MVIEVENIKEKCTQNFVVNLKFPFCTFEHCDLKI